MKGDKGRKDTDISTVPSNQTEVILVFGQSYGSRITVSVAVAAEGSQVRSSGSLFHSFGS